MDEKKDERAPEVEETERGEHNRIGYYNADEDATHDERGTQGEGEGERPRENA
jgi:hypothetical protein